MIVHHDIVYSIHAPTQTLFLFIRLKNSILQEVKCCTFISSALLKPVNDNLFLKGGGGGVVTTVCQIVIALESGRVT